MSAISKFLKDLREPLDIPLQLVAAEMDTSGKRIKYLNPDLCSDKITAEKFNKFVQAVESGELGTEISSIDDNTVLYEFDSEAVVIHSTLGVKWILFDSAVTVKVESALIAICQYGVLSYCNTDDAHRDGMGVFLVTAIKLFNEIKLNTIIMRQFQFTKGEIQVMVKVDLIDAQAQLFTIMEIRGGKGNEFETIFPWHQGSVLLRSDLVGWFDNYSAACPLCPTHKRRCWSARAPDRLT